MILSFHPCFTGDKNIICAGRDPDQADIDALKRADIVVLPQGCSANLYHLARENCTHVFPDYDARFSYPGKIGQIRMFRELNAPHPDTEIYPSLEDFYNYYGGLSKMPDMGIPFVFKFNWGGDGDNVFLVESPAVFQAVLQRALSYERTGQRGFLIQEYIRARNRSLRVAVIGQSAIAYWRIQKQNDHFRANLSKGAVTDFESDPELRAMAVDSAKSFCKKTGINLAGFDFLFHDSGPEIRIRTPLFLEINYFFGRRGLGGSEKFYDLLNSEIRKWIESL